MESPPGGDYLTCVMRRTRTAMSPDVVRPEVKAEQLRRRQALKLWEAIEVEDMSHAKSKLEKATRDLDAEQQQSSSSSIVTTMTIILRKELTQLLSMATWNELLTCLLAAWTSHNRQRCTGRGDAHSVGMFVTPLMPVFMEQAIKLEENPEMQLQPVEEDIKKMEGEARAAARARIHQRFNDDSEAGEEAAAERPRRRVPIRSSTTKIQRIGASLRGILNDKASMNIITPVAVAIGPFHHGLPELQEMEEAKHAAVEDFCRAARLAPEVVLERISPVAASTRSSYTGDGTHGGDFAEMMLLDACFLLQFMVSMCPRTDNGLPEAGLLMWRAEVQTRIDAIVRDIMLLENQIPWPVLEALMELRTEPSMPIVERFLDLMASFLDVGSNSFGGQGRADPPPDHLLDLFYRRHMGAVSTQELFVPKMSSISSTAVELAEMGVRLTAGKDNNKFGDMIVKKRKWAGDGLGLFGELSLAPLVLNELTACWLINMAAYEACLGATQADNFAVSSYISVIALFMNREEDVQELRSKGIVQSAFSNEETLAFFKWAARHIRVGHRYYQVFEQLQEYKQDRYVWIAIHRFVYNNYKIIATLLSIAGVLVGLFKTILSLKQ